MTEPEQPAADFHLLRSGPIHHPRLPPELLELIRSIYDVVGPYLNTPLEQFEISFMRDRHPESKVAVWCSITAAWIAYHENHLSDELLPDEDEQALLSALIAIAAGVEEAEKLDVPIDVGRRLLACYDDLAED